MERWQYGFPLCQHSRRQLLEGNIVPVVTQSRMVIPETRLEESIATLTFNPQLCRTRPTVPPTPVPPTMANYRATYTRPTVPTTPVPDLDNVPPWRANQMELKRVSRGRGGRGRFTDKTEKWKPLSDKDNDKDREVETPQEEPEDAMDGLDESEANLARREAQKDTDELVQKTRRNAPKVLKPSQPNQPPPEHLVQASHQSRQPPHQGDLAPQSGINETVMTDRPHMDEDSDEPDEAERTEEPILSIFVQTLGEDIGRPDILDNIRGRISDHSTMVSSFMHDNEWFVRLNSAQQANRVCGRLNHCWILKHTILIRCGVCAEQD